MTEQVVEPAVGIKATIAITPQNNAIECTDVDKLMICSEAAAPSHPAIIFIITGEDPHVLCHSIVLYAFLKII
jgi:hypothetical protein